MTIAAGIDIGTGAVKAAVVKVENGDETWLSRSSLRIRQRDPIELARLAYDNALEDAKLAPQGVNYVATTGEGESVPFHTGHFYSMTSRARRHLPRTGIPGCARCRSVARPCDQHRSTWEGAELQDD